MRNLALMCLLVAFFSAPHAQAQNPTAEACGLPAAGSIVATVTYTLSADCTQTGSLDVLGPPGGQPGLTLTIDGAGNTIKLGAGAWSFATTQDTRNAIVLRNVTIDGQYNKRSVIIEAKSFSAEKVTFTRNYGTVLNATSITMTNVLFTSNLFDGVGFGVNGGTLNISGSASATVTNAVFRYNRNMNIVLHSGGSLTTTGCLTFSGNLPYNVVHSGVWASAGSWTDNSTGECSGEIGNGDSASLPPVPVSPCGLPASLALIDTDVTFTLRGDCEGIIGLVVSEGVQATIRGNGYRISRNASLPASFRVAGDARLRISDAIFDMGQLVTYGTLTVSHSELRNSANLALINYGTASFSNMLFQDNSAPSFAGLYYAGSPILKGIGTFSDSRFDGVSGGSAALRANGSTVVLNLKNCIIFEGLAQGYPATLAQGGATLNDNRDSAACNPTVGPRPPVKTENPGSNSKSTAHEPPVENCDAPPSVEALAMGSEACIFRRDRDGDTIMQVYEIDQLTSQGFHQLTVAQSQISPLQGENIVAVSADGRALAVVWPDGNVTVKLGPNSENKIPHITLGRGLSGPVIETTSTFGPPPGLPYIGLALPYRVQAGNAPPSPATQNSATSNCMVTTLYILNFRDAPGGNIKYFLPYNVTLTAFERAADWFLVDYHGDRGWVSADYVTPVGSCG